MENHNAEKFTLEIRLTNEAMETTGDIVTQLRKVANLIESYGVNAPQRIKDANGNTVGEWSFSS